MFIQIMPKSEQYLRTKYNRLFNIVLLSFSCDGLGNGFQWKPQFIVQRSSISQDTIYLK